VALRAEPKSAIAPQMYSSSGEEQKRLLLVPQEWAQIHGISMRDGRRRRGQARSSTSRKYCRNTMSLAFEGEGSCRQNSIPQRREKQAAKQGPQGMFWRY